MKHVIILKTWYLCMCCLGSIIAKTANTDLTIRKQSTKTIALKSIWLKDLS